MRLRIVMVVTHCHQPVTSKNIHYASQQRDWAVSNTSSIPTEHTKTHLQLNEETSGYETQSSRIRYHPPRRTI